MHTFVFLLFLLFSFTASAAEFPVGPGESIQDAISQAQPGDEVVVAAGEYNEALETVRDGEPSNPITIRGEGAVVITTSGRVVDVQHANIHFDSVTLDGQYGDRDLIRVGNDGDGFQIRNSEVRRSGRDCVDMGSVSDIRFESVVIHHCLNWDGDRVDAHGITGASVTNVEIIDTEIHTFTGDAIQFDPGRTSPGWTDVVIDGCSFWLEPLSEESNGVPAGTVPGENAIDTKTFDGTERARLTIRNTVAYGFRGGLISNMSVFNIKENVEALFDGVQIWNSEIAFRLRGAVGDASLGSATTIHNTVVYDVDTAVRYEDDIQVPITMYNVTIGLDVQEMFDRASAPDNVLDLRNWLVVDSDVPAEASGAGNFRSAVAEFVDAENGDYRPVETATFLDQGERLPDVTADLLGTPRPQADGYDPGAYEFTLGEPGDPNNPDPIDGNSNNGDGTDDGTNGGGTNNVHSNDSSSSEDSGCSAIDAKPDVMIIFFAVGLWFYRRRM